MIDHSSPSIDSDNINDIVMNDQIAPDDPVLRQVIHNFKKFKMSASRS